MCFPRLFRSALSPQIFPAKVHKCARRARLCTRRAVPDTPSRYMAKERERERERDRERGRETTVLLIASPVTPATYTRQIFYSSRFARALVSPPSNKRERAVERGP